VPPPERNKGSTAAPDPYRTLTAGSTFLISPIRSVGQPGCVHITDLLAAAATDGSGDLLVGLLIGACIGFLAGPIVRSRLAYREWSEASRQARLTDELLSRMQEDPDRDAEPDRDDSSDHRRSWQTLP
jgi:hypothetical protein